MHHLDFFRNFIVSGDCYINSDVSAESQNSIVELVRPVDWLACSIIYRNIFCPVASPCYIVGFKSAEFRLVIKVIIYVLHIQVDILNSANINSIGDVNSSAIHKGIVPCRIIWEHFKIEWRVLNVSKLAIRILQFNIEPVVSSLKEQCIKCIVPITCMNVPFIRLGWLLGHVEVSKGDHKLCKASRITLGFYKVVEYVVD